MPPLKYFDYKYGSHDSVFFISLVLAKCEKNLSPRHR